MTKILLRIGWREIAILGLLLALGWSHLTRPEDAEPLATLSHQAGLITSAEDLKSAPVQAIRYGDVPDSTRTDCIEVPTWVAQTSKTDSGSAYFRPQVQGEALSRQPERGLHPLAGLPYVITPMTSGRPSLSVRSSRVVLQAFDPRSGRPLAYEYDIDRPKNTLSAYAATQLLPGTAAAHSGLAYAHTWRDVPVLSSLTAAWHAGYGVTTAGPGPVGGVTLTADIRW